MGAGALAVARRSSCPGILPGLFLTRNDWQREQPGQAFALRPHGPVRPDVGAERAAGGASMRGSKLLSVVRLRTERRRSKRDAGQARQNAISRPTPFSRMLAIVISAAGAVRLDLHY
jgi:hypothetical protein